MARRLVTLLVVASFAGFVLVAAGCGGDDKTSAPDTTTTATTPITEETDTTATETESTDTESTETTDTTSTTTDFASSENCQEFAQIGSKISGALTGSGDIGDVQGAFDQLAEAAPDEIKDDFTTLAGYFGQLADALEGYDPSSGQAPSAEALAKIQAIDSAGATEASQNISTWAQENCSGS